MAESENLLFDRNDPGEDHSDIWDDTALIEAYDNAVKLVKSHIDAKKGVNSQETEETKQKPKEKKKKHKKKAHKQPSGTWKPGQRCRAVYSEDGETYEAIIRSVNSDDATCVVRYLGYGNEESQNMGDLLPSAPVEEKTVQVTSDVRNFTSESSDIYSPKAPSKHPDPAQEEAPPFPMPSMFPLMNPMAQCPPQIPAFPPMNVSEISVMVDIAGSAPFLPPPPSFEMIDDIASDKEALYSMLISWYMSGYHTGFYQGLQKSRRSESSRASKRPKDISHRR
ncbi:hypothetical protein CAPTEDRAFT_170515 [Capitella teleta]|uniref:Tudor domain-containing protein n=1 Tax=Capitella teleta TaxID=283909 RepID=R7TZS0_CAPTE|nr:hypothetical protein CAPTEDRAFT_170515 [Capitella teleta]|eukprot:ELT96430.1 hypothetical protein CAPTEDRAFT_170515 [Capitella teleta]